MVHEMAGVRSPSPSPVPLPPPPVPVTVTVNGPFRNRAVAVRAADIDSVQTSFPLQSPLQPTNEWAGSSGLAVRLTMVPDAKLAEHPVPAARPAVIVQLMPAGLEV